MAKGISSSIDTKKLLKALKKLPINIQKNVMVGSTRAGAKVVSDEAKRLAPSKRGVLKKSIGITKRKTKRGITTFSVSPRKGGRNNGFYGRFIELGTSKMIARPFLRPALEKSVDEVLVASKKYIEKRLPKEVAKAKR